MSLVAAFKIGVWNAWIFTSVFLLQMLVIMVAGRQVWDRSHLPIEVKRTRLERHAGTVANLAWLLALGYSVFLPLRLGCVCFFIGFFVFFIGLILMTMATFAFITAPAGQAITKGIYAFSRHPMYAATFLICLGAGIAGGSWLFVLLSVIMVICCCQEALSEEKYCLDRYGSIYQAYKSRTPRWIGFPKRIDN
jgi:protein-S-isoprenylcysteine O-methyltransferase Ste14